MERLLRMATMAMGLAVMTPPAASANTECYVALHAGGSAARPLVEQRACDGHCVFEVQACINQPGDGCQGTVLDRLTVSAGRRREGLALPSLGGEPACGSASFITLAPGERLTLRAKGVTRTGRRDRDRVMLRCRQALGDGECGPQRDAVGATPPELCEQWKAASALGQQTDHPPSIPLPASCRDDASNYATPAVQLDPAASEELHVIGVYEGESPSAGDEFPPPRGQGVVRVNVRPRPLPVALMLSAYESVRWDIQLEPGAVLSRVVAQGYYEPEVRGVPAGVPVTIRRYDETCGAYGYGWELPQNEGGGDYPLLRDETRWLFGLTETSYEGCYRAGQFDVPYWTGDPPAGERPHADGDETIPRLDVSFPGCEAVTAESVYCLTVSEGRPAVLGLESGTVCPVVEPSRPIGPLFLSSSLAWRGEILYACKSGELLRVSLRDGVVEGTAVRCEAVTDDGARLLIQQGGTSGAIHAYPTYADVIAGTPAASYPSAGALSLMTASAARLLVTWPAVNRIETVDLRTGEPGAPLTLPGYDYGINALSETGDGGLAVSSGLLIGDTVHLLDVASGRRLCDRHATAPPEGLACVSRRSSPLTCALDPAPGTP